MTPGLGLVSDPVAELPPCASGTERTVDAQTGTQRRPASDPAAPPPRTHLRPMGASVRARPAASPPPASEPATAPPARACGGCLRGRPLQAPPTDRVSTGSRAGWP
jgi:hypothetical protein